VYIIWIFLANDFPGLAVPEWVFLLIYSKGFPLRQQICVLWMYNGFCDYDVYVLYISIIYLVIIIAYIL
jgi:hypothetical protein